MLFYHERSRRTVRWHDHTGSSDVRDLSATLTQPTQLHRSGCCSQRNPVFIGNPPSPSARRATRACARRRVVSQHIKYPRFVQFKTLCVSYDPNFTSHSFVVSVISSADLTAFYANYDSNLQQRPQRGRLTSHGSCSFV